MTQGEHANVTRKRPKVDFNQGLSYCETIGPLSHGVIASCNLVVSGSMYAGMILIILWTCIINKDSLLWLECNY